MNPKHATFIRAHTVSAAIAAGYAFILHILVYVSFAVAYLAQGGIGTATFMLPIAVIILGLILFFFIRHLPPEKLTFYVSLLIVHILLSVLFIMLGESIIEPLITVLQNAVGIVLTGQPEENYDGLALLFNWLLLSVGMGLFFFLAMVISMIRTELGKVMGTVRRQKKSRKELPKS